jgi:NAD-dependent SIR2 family protein deacetylase
MPNSETCERCKGKGYYEALVSQHDDKKETVKCEKCKKVWSIRVCRDNLSAIFIILELVKTEEPLKPIEIIEVDEEEDDDN